MNGLRMAVAEDVEEMEIPRAEQDGFFELDGVKYGTAYAWAKVFGMREVKAPSTGLDGFNSNNTFYSGCFYSEAQMRELYPERFRTDIPRAERDGFFELGGIRYGHQTAWLRYLGVTLQKDIPAGIDGYNYENQFLPKGFISEAQMRELYPERFRTDIPRAEEGGFFLKGGEYYGSQTAWQPFVSRAYFRKLSGGLDGYSSANKFVKGGFYRKQQLILAYPNLFQKHVEALLSTFEVHDFSDWLVSLRHFYDFLELGPIDRPYPLVLVNLFTDWSRGFARKFPAIKRYLRLIEMKPKRIESSCKADGNSVECVYLDLKDLCLWEGSSVRVDDQRSAEERSILIRYEALVRSLAYKYKGALPLEDALQEARIGLLKAWRTYEPNKGSFKNYARWLVRAAITQARSFADGDVRLPESVRELRRNIGLVLREVAVVTGARTVPVHVLAERTGKSRRCILDVLASTAYSPVSLDANIHGSEGIRLHDVLAGETSPPLQREYLIRFFERASRVAVVGKDDVNYWEVFLNAYGFYGDKVFFQTVADGLRVSREGVRQRALASFRCILADPECARLLLELGISEEQLSAKLNSR